MIRRTVFEKFGTCGWPGLQWFDAVFPAGEADYQAVLDALAAADRPKEAHWLMDKAGPDLGAVLVVDELTGRHCFAAGRLVVRGAVDLAGDLRARAGFVAHGRVRVGGRLDATTVVAHGGVTCDGDIVGISLETDGDIRSGAAIRLRGDLDAHEREVIAGGDVVAYEVRAGDITVGGQLRARGAIRSRGGLGILAKQGITASEIHALGMVQSEAGISAGEVHAVDCISAGGDLAVARDVVTDWDVRAAGLLDVGGRVRAGRNVYAKLLRAGAVEQAGDVYATQIICPVRPDNIITGQWRPYWGAPVEAEPAADAAAGETPSP